MYKQEQYSDIFPQRPVQLKTNQESRAFSRFSRKEKEAKIVDYLNLGSCQPASVT
jgi:hypothetical protein